jgi:hypothetical protein
MEQLAGLTEEAPRLATKFIMLKLFFDVGPLG